MDARPAELAGRWYPSSKTACDQFLDAVPTPAPPLEGAIGAIVPHAGWTYSGAVAWGTLRLLKDARPDPELVLIFGGHLAPRDTPRVLIDGGWETPYGTVAIAKSVAEDLTMAVASDIETPDEYYDDNAIEVLMPMIKKAWPNTPAVTVGAPPISEATALGAELVDRARARGYQNIVVIGSTDLTHYGPNYSFSPQGRGHTGLQWVKSVNDPALIEQMVQMDAPKVIWKAARERNACCAGAAAAAITAAKKLGASKGAVVEYTTSWDVRPSEPEPTSFVGYVGLLLGR